MEAVSIYDPERESAGRDGPPAARVRPTNPPAFVEHVEVRELVVMFRGEPLMRFDQINGGIMMVKKDYDRFDANVILRAMISVAIERGVLENSVRLEDALFHLDQIIEHPSQSERYCPF